MSDVLGAEQAGPRRPIMVALCGPSGVGKSSVVKLLREADRTLYFSVAATTRAPRPGEVGAGVYQFVTIEEFRRMRSHDRFAESAERFGHLYGELLEPLEAAITRGAPILFDTDAIGASQISLRYPGCLTTVGLLPPSIAELGRRLEARANGGERLMQARSAIVTVSQCDHVIVNDDLGETVRSVAAIFSAERTKQHRCAAALPLIREFDRRIQM